MTEHRIKLRGGWRWVEPAGTDTGRPVTLPLVWPAGRTARVRLIRSFQRPPIDPARESLALHLEDVPGLTLVQLNDRALARPGPEAATLWVSLDEPLPLRNLLVLDVAPPQSRGSEADGLPWGNIALVIRSVVPGAGGVESLGEREPSP